MSVPRRPRDTRCSDCGHSRNWHCEGLCVIKKHLTEDCELCSACIGECSYLSRENETTVQVNWYTSAKEMRTRGCKFWEVLDV